jgi:hypothetical protein
VADGDERPPLPRLAAQRLGERGLADARLPADQHEAAPPIERGFPPVA